MQNHYILKEYTSFIEVEKSKFISIVIPVDKDFDIKNKLQEVKKLYPKANHYIYAIKTDAYSKSNDDGEPSGTAGRPTLDLIDKNDLFNVCIITIRYFGGIKLGAGRLLRTYIASAEEVLKISEKFEKILQTTYLFQIDVSKRNIFNIICSETKEKYEILEYNDLGLKAKITSSSLNIDRYKNVNGIELVETKEEFIYKGV